MLKTASSMPVRWNSARIALRNIFSWRDEFLKKTIQHLICHTFKIVKITWSVNKDFTGMRQFINNFTFKNQFSIPDLMAMIFGAEHISWSAVSTCDMATIWVLLCSSSPANSVARLHMSSARRASPERAATWIHKMPLLVNHTKPSENHQS